MQLTFEQIPAVVSQLFEKLESIEHLLLQQKKADNANAQATDDLIVIKQAAEFLHLSLALLHE